MVNKVKVQNDAELKDRLVAINRVTKVTKGGRTFTFAAIVVVGDGNGKGTVPHEAFAKFGGARVLIMPASEGTGVVAGGAMRAVLESVGITDVLAKSKGSSNPHNLVKATIEALANMRDAKTVAQNRGVNLTKVFKG